jgi:hypothetical protein
LGAAPTEGFLALLDQVLRSRQPANVDRASVTVTGEGPAEGIVLIPHRGLGGFSLVAWFSAERIELGWGSVIDLEYHDELDLATRVAEFTGGSWIANPAVVAALVAELRRPIRLRARRTRLLRQWQLRCAVELDGKWKESRACNIPGPETGGREASVDLGYTTLMGPEPPRVRYPVPLATWHRYAEPAWPSTPRP